MYDKCLACGRPIFTVRSGPAMTAIDRAALIEKAAVAVGGASARTDGIHADRRRDAVDTALLVIAREMLAPLRELHRGKHLDDGTDPSGPRCLVCLELDPCRTMEMLDQIEADAKGDER